MHADAERVQMSTTQPQYYDSLADLLLGTFRILRHVPLTALGLHWMAHFASASEEDWHKIGDTLAPKTIWNELFTKPGLLTLVIQETRKKEPSEFTTVAVEPSSKVRPGVFFEVHDHYEVVPAEPPDVEQVMALLREQWQPSFRRAKKVMNHILDKILV
jgi:hypothetical protein